MNRNDPRYQMHEEDSQLLHQTPYKILIFRIAVVFSLFAITSLFGAFAYLTLRDYEHRVFKSQYGK